MQRFRQAELSWLRSGQTTTLFSSETEKEPVSAARGGMASIEEGGEGGRRGAREGSRTSMAAAQRCSGEERWRRALSVGLCSCGEKQ